MSLSTDFLTTQNISLLWDILSDGDIIKNSSKQYVENVFNMFKHNVRGFYEVESKKPSTLVDLNKKYILLILNYVNNGQHEFANNQAVYKKPSATPPLVTFEDIQNNRQTQFEKDLNRHQNEFTSAMTVPVPPVPDFSIKLDDEPIKEISEKIRQMTVSRNYDIEQINKTHANSQQNWLKPEETSLKAEKLSINKVTRTSTNDTPPNTNNTHSENGLKYIKIDNYEMDGNVYKNQIIDLNRQESKKHISWEDENIKMNMTEAIEKEIENNIFAKLKKIETPFIDKKEDPSFALQVQINNIYARIDILNANVAKIMELLDNKNETI
jgi:hypothetical protein